MEPMTGTTFESGTPKLHHGKSNDFLYNGFVFGLSFTKSAKWKGFEAFILDWVNKYDEAIRKKLKKTRLCILTRYPQLGV